MSAERAGKKPVCPTLFEEDSQNGCIICKSHVSPNISSPKIKKGFW
jgi:hypothetical protein